MADYDKVPQIRDEFVTRIWYAAERHGLNIPFPIRTVYHNPPTKANTDAVLNSYIEYIYSFPSFANVNHEIITELIQNASIKIFWSGRKGDRSGNAH